MKTIEEIFDEIIKNDQVSYMYYYDVKPSKYGSFRELLKDAEGFHNEYFKLGEKACLLDDKLMNEFRKKHSVYLYFLGLYLYDNIPTITESIDNKILANGKNINFRYIWYLTSLYHDYFFDIEEYPEKFSAFIEKQELNFLTGLRIQNKCIPSKITGVINNYNLYKYHLNIRLYTHRERSPFEDHGIIAGMAFYQIMEKLHSLNINKVIDKRIVFYEQNMINVIPKIAYALIGHNIFQKSPNDDEANKYRYFGLCKLIRKKPLVKLKRHPLLFLLDLVDTIDPFKVLNGNIDSALSKHICINSHRNKLDISSFGIKEDKLSWLINTEPEQKGKTIKQIVFTKHGQHIVTE